MKFKEKDMKWSINNLMVMAAAQPNTVTMSNFTIASTQNGLSGSVTYSVNLLPATETFTPFDQITEAQAVAWTKEALGPDRVMAMENEVRAQIEAQLVAVPQSAPLPWAALVEGVPA